MTSHNPYDLNPFSSPVFSSFLPHLLLFLPHTSLFSSFLFQQKSFFWPPFLLFWKSRWMGGEKRVEERESGSEVWMRRVRMRRKMVWMTTAIDLKSPLEYFFWASLSYEPNISVWVSCSGEEYIVHPVLTLLHPA